MMESLSWWLTGLDPVTRRVTVVVLLTLLVILAGCVLAVVNNLAIYIMLLTYALLLIVINEPIKAQAWLANGLHQKTTIRDISIGAAIAEVVVWFGLAVLS
jgi:hypothetical protein